MGNTMFAPVKCECWTEKPLGFHKAADVVQLK
jgi:hypothetical protein